MTARRTRKSAISDAPGDGAARLLRNAAFALLLAAMVARVFISELPYRQSPLPAGIMPTAEAPPAGGEREPTIRFADRTELARVSFAVMLLTAAALWALAGATAGRLEVRHGYLVWLITAFAVLSLASALAASDRRGSLDTWVEQVSLLSAGFLAVQLCRDHRRFGLLMIVLLGVAVAVAAKGYYQVFVEIPDRIAYFEANRVQRLLEEGIRPGTPRARLFEARLRDRTPLGFFVLANVFASLLVVLLPATAAVAADKFRAARRNPLKGKRGEIDLAVLGAVLAAAVAVAAVPVWLLTRSLGGIFAGAVALLGGAGVFALRARLARHWRKLVVATAAVWMLGGAAVVGYGLARDRLPTRTMTFRWYYWTASAEIVRDRPLLGAGPGNFADAYLHHRRPAAEEAVKNPHNVVVHAFAEYGLIAGAVYLAIPVVMLVGMCRPRRAADDEQDGQSPSELSARAAIAVCCVAVVAMLAARGLFTVDGADPNVFIYGAALPAIVLAGGLALGLLDRSISASLDVPAGACRIALVAGAVGFLLHGMVEISLWVPATGLVFYVVAGAALARAGGGGRRLLRRSAIPVAAACMAVVVAVLAVLWRPVYRRASLYDEAVSVSADGRFAVAERLLIQAAESDPLDPLAAGDAARFILDRCQATTGQRQCLLRADRWAMEAAGRDPASPRWPRLAGDIAWRLAELDDDPEARAEALQRLRSAVRRDPMNMRLRLRYAEKLVDAGRFAEAMADLQQIEKIDRRLFPDSFHRLTDDERLRIDSLRDRAADGGQ